MAEHYLDDSVVHPPVSNLLLLNYLSWGHTSLRANIKKYATVAVGTDWLAGPLPKGDQY